MIFYKNIYLGNRIQPNSQIKRFHEVNLIHHLKRFFRESRFETFLEKSKTLPNALSVAADL